MGSGCSNQSNNKSEYCKKCKQLLKFCCDKCKNYVKMAESPWEALHPDGNLWCMECKKGVPKDLYFKNIGVCLCTPGAYG